MKKKLPENRPKTSVIYVRVSSKDQAEHGNSLPAQQKNCEEYCHTKGWEVLRVFVERGESAKTADRTQLILMQDFCLKNMGKVGYLVVWKLDRFARNQYDHLMLRKFFRDVGVDLKSATEVIENTPIGKASEGMLAVMSEYENNVKIERTIMGMRDIALEGRWPTGAPWGYKNTREIPGDDKSTRIIVPDPERAHIVEFIFEEYARGTIKISDLTKKVKEKYYGVKSKRGRNMWPQLVHKILRNPIHAGRVVFKKFGVSVKGIHKPIISEALFDEVQDIMDGKTGRKQPRSRDHPDFPLRGVLCDACGRAMTGGISTGRWGGKYYYYNCVNRACPKKWAIRKKDMEDDFTEFLSSITPDEGVLNALAEAISVVHSRNAHDAIAQTKRIDKQLEKIEEELDGLLSMRLRGVLKSDEDYLIQSERRKAKQRELMLEKQQLINPATAVEADVRFGITVIKELPSTWKTLTPGELRVLRGLLFPENVRYQRPKFKTPKLSCIYKLKSVKPDELAHYVTLPGVGPGFRA